MLQAILLNRIFHLVKQYNSSMCSWILEFILCNRALKEQSDQSLLFAILPTKLQIRGDIKDNSKIVFLISQ